MPSRYNHINIYTYSTEWIYPSVFSPLFTHAQLHKTVGKREICVKVVPSAGTALE